MYNLSLENKSSTDKYSEQEQQFSMINSQFLVWLDTHFEEWVCDAIHTPTQVISFGCRAETV